MDTIFKTLVASGDGVIAIVIVILIAIFLRISTKFDI